MCDGHQMLNAGPYIRTKYIRHIGGRVFARLRWPIITHHSRGQNKKSSDFFVAFFASQHKNELNQLKC